MIEQAMILANQCVATYLHNHNQPAIYRVHNQPTSDTLSQLAQVFDEFSWFKRIDRELFIAGNAHELQRVLDESMGRLEEYLVNTLLIRAMNRAIYQVAPSEHYGLGSEIYTHFTSPIRRYPDLVVHRMIKEVLGITQQESKAQKAQHEALTWISQHASDQEREADRAAYESQEVKLIEYMERFIGQTCTGVVSNVSTSGLSIRFANTAEAFLDVRNLGTAYFSFDPLKRMLRSDDGMLTYRLGQRIDVRIKQADPKIRLLECVLAR